VLIHRWSCLRLEGIVVDTVCYMHDDGYLAVSVSHWALDNCALLYTLTVELSVVLLCQLTPSMNRVNIFVHPIKRSFFTQTNVQWSGYMREHTWCCGADVS